MGSYISIENDTTVPWMCHVGPDQKAIGIATIVTTVIGVAATIIATAGSAAPIVSAIGANGIISIMGVSTSSLAAVTGLAGAVASYTTAIGAASSFGMTVAKGISDNLISKDYKLLAPGQTVRWPKMSLSLWQQGHCMKTEIIDPATVRTSWFYMRPIFSGATNKKTNNYRIKKFGTNLSTQDVKASTKTTRERVLEFTDGMQPTDSTSMVFIYPNGTMTNADGSPYVPEE